MTPKYKVGDLFKCDIQTNLRGRRCTDFAEIISISETMVIYHWLGLNDSDQYSYPMDVKTFDEAIEENSYQLIPCDSEQQKLAILLKYS